MKPEFYSCYNCNRVIALTKETKRNYPYCIRCIMNNRALNKLKKELGK